MTANIDIQGDWSRWVIDDNVDNGPARIQSKEKGLTNLPRTGWQYADNGSWYDDNTMTFIGDILNIS